ncbi:MAG: AbrB/MazE/SpoVT family DNA-binding domain-containing protein [Chitinivibrionales bacterium]|nr:AbrB/MazE/SpoVT family DNA-binding domain-containing protein [Chitinivibrionales bacterium]
MMARLQKWGNSQGIRFPRELLRQTSIAVGEEVDISVKQGAIIVKPGLGNRGKYRLKDLLSKMPAHYRLREEQWGKPVGKESW